MKVVTGLERFEGHDEATMASYLGVLVRNTLTDRLRYSTADRRDPRRLVDPGPAGTEGREADSSALAVETTPSSQASAAEQVNLYRAELERFPDRERRLLQMRIEGATPFGILAKELAYPSEDAARKAYRGARVRLLRRLQQRGVGCS